MRAKWTSHVARLVVLRVVEGHRLSVHEWLHRVAHRVMLAGWPLQAPPLTPATGAPWLHLQRIICIWQVGQRVWHGSWASCRACWGGEAGGFLGRPKGRGELGRAGLWRLTLSKCQLQERPRAYKAGKAEIQYGRVLLFGEPAQADAVYLSPKPTMHAVNNLPRTLPALTRTQGVGAAARAAFLPEWSAGRGGRKGCRHA